jgi:hypothetical protein
VAKIVFHDVLDPALPTIRNSVGNVGSEAKRLDDVTPSAIRTLPSATTVPEPQHLLAKVDLI